jgi:hypothetical protein
MFDSDRSIGNARHGIAVFARLFHRRPICDRFNETKGASMFKVTALVIAIVVLGFDLARAQDIPGIEDCSKTSGLDKRTGCFQSNIDFLIKVIAKNAADARQRLSAATNEIAALQKEVADLRIRVDQIQNATQKADSK